MRSLALRDEVLRGSKPFPVLQCALVARKMSLGSIVVTTEFRELPVGEVTHVSSPGGWSPIEYGTGIKDNSYKTVTASVGVVDKTGELLSTLEAYDPRGSSCSIDSACAGLSAGDWEPLFRGVLSDWERKDLITVLHLKTDDTVLRSPIPANVFNRTEWGSAEEGTIFSTPMPLVLGVHDSQDVTGRGMVPAVNIRWDKDNGYWWLASVDRLVEVTRIYFDGVLQDSTVWSVQQGMFGSSYCTIIVIPEAYLPINDDGSLKTGVVVTFDCKGPDNNGLSSGNTLTGAPDQLRAIINEYAYRRSPLSGWRGDLSIIGDGWDIGSAVFALYKIESARRFGGDQNPESLAEIIDSFLKAYPWVRIWWNELGQLDFCVIIPDDVEPDEDAWLDLYKYHEGGQLIFKPGDRREVYTHLLMPFMESSAEQKFLASYEAHDVAALEEKVVLVIDNPWSQGQFKEGTVYNPAAPADPTP